MALVTKKEKISVEKSYIEGLKKKAIFLEEILSFIEEKYLGYLMQETEKEKNISLQKAKKELN